MTSHPKDLSDDLIMAIKECDKVCKHMHLSLIHIFKQWDEYKNAIKSAETLEELADALNEWSNIFDNGAVYSVKEY